MNKLASLGFLKKTIMETIISTYNVEGSPTVAPMGVETEDMQRIVIRPYTSSLTYKNLQLKKCAVINVTSNPELYYWTAFKEVNPSGRVPGEWFGKAEAVDAPRLLLADAFIEVSVLNLKSLRGRRGEVLCSVKLVKTPNILPKAYCRATFAMIESIIHATRVKVFLTSGEYKKAERLVKLIKYYSTIVERVAQDSRYSKIMTDLIQRIDSWKNEN